MALTVSFCALAFTVLAFWWLNLRASALVIAGQPRSFGFANTSADGVHLILPLAFWADGPTPVVVINLELRPVSPDGLPLLRFMATVERVGGMGDRWLATAIAIRPRDALVMCCEFRQNAPKTFAPQPGVDLEFELWGLVQRSHRKPHWQKLLGPRIVITNELVAQQNQLIPYDNFPAH